VIKAVFFDLDGTLYDRDTLVRELVAAQFDAFSGELPSLSRERFVSDVLDMDDHGYGEKEKGYQRVVADWQLDSGLASRLCAHFWSVYDQYCHLSPDTATTLDTLQAHGKRLGVITNGGTTRQRAKLAALGLADRFDVVLVSEAEGVRKPDAEIFRRAVQGCGVSVSEAAFVGDHPETDIVGARNAGLLPIWRHVPDWSPVAADTLTVYRLVDILPTCLRSE
jgi:putative hydrolase of the HAD superfamily